MCDGCGRSDGGAVMSEIIKLENVIRMVEGERRAVNGVSLIINNKERVAFCGASGSGMSTLMCLIAGMERPSCGKIFVSGSAVHEMNSDTAAKFRSRTFGILQRKPAFMENMTVQENVALPLAISDIPAVKRQKAAKEQLRTLGLGYAAHAHPSQLSLLERHMVSIARAFITLPQIFLIDDIAAELSEKDSEKIKQILFGRWQLGEYTILAFTGTGSSLLKADRTFALAHGIIQEEII